MGKYCQFNEEEITDKIFDFIGWDNKFIVEFGCHASHLYSNSQRFKEDGFNVLQFGVEGEPLINEFFTAENVNQIFKKYKVPKDLDFLSIDVDGMDYWIWKALKYEPKVVCIEYNPKREDGIQPYNAQNVWNGYCDSFFGSCKEELVKLGEEKGYILIDENPANLFFVKKLYEDKLGSWQ